MLGAGARGPKLTDKTKVGAKTWAELRTAAMKADYKTTAWFVSFLSFCNYVNSTLNRSFCLKNFILADMISRMHEWLHLFGY